MQRKCLYCLNRIEHKGIVEKMATPNANKHANRNPCSRLALAYIVLQNFQLKYA